MPEAVAVVIACLLGARPSLALACPDCPLARATRAAFWEEPGVWAHLTLLLLPFLVVWLVSLWLFKRGGRSPGFGKDG